ncbi:MAG TPA: response regulator [Nitrospirales bacterium]|jgi:DNA-binding response OmpR family regulator
MEPPKKKILIVENDFHSCIGLRDSLTKEGYQVVTASNSFEAIMKMKEDVNIGIFDLDLPAILGFTISGWELVGIFRAWHPNGSIIVVSAQEEYDAATARRWRIADCLVKPITASRIKTLVKAIETERKLSVVSLDGAVQ